MECPNCGRQTPDEMTVCRYCGIAPRPPLWRRLAEWFRAPRVGAPADRPARRTSPEDEPRGIEMPAGSRTVTVGLSTVSTTRRDGQAVESLPADIREALREVAGTEGTVYYERVVSDDSSGPVVSERGMPLDPQLQAALAKLLEAEAATTEQQIVVEVNGDRQVYRSADEIPPEVRKMLGQFADAPLARDADAP